MRGEKSDFERDVESMFASIDAIDDWKGESAGDGGRDYRVFAADGYTASEAAEAVEMTPVPNGHPITISSATDDWFWVGVRP